jgi:hypothetical protein
MHSSQKKKSRVMLRAKAVLGAADPLSCFSMKSRHKYHNMKIKIERNPII